MGAGGNGGTGGGEVSHSVLSELVVLDDGKATPQTWPVAKVAAAHGQKTAQ